METTTLSSKGQIIIPKAVRAAYRWEPGVEFVIEEVGSGILLKPRNPFPPTRVEDGLGCAGYDGPAKTVEQMTQGILDEARRRWRKTAKR